MYATSDFNQLNNDVNNRLNFDRLTVAAPAGEDSDAVELVLTADVGVAMLNTLLAGGGAGLVWQQLL